MTNKKEKFDWIGYFIVFLASIFLGYQYYIGDKLDASRGSGKSRFISHILNKIESIGGVWLVWLLLAIMGLTGLYMGITTLKKRLNKDS